MRTDRLITDKEMVGHEWYCDYCRPLDIFYAVGSLLPLIKQDDFAVLGVHRSRSRGAFADKEVAQIGMFIPHLQRALRLSQTLAGVHCSNSIQEAALRKLGVGLILVDSKGSIMFANEIAEAILRSREGLIDIHGKLNAALAPERPRFFAAIRAIANGCDRNRVSGSQSIQLTATGRGKINVLVCPIPRFGLISIEVPAALIIINNSLAGTPGLVGALGLLYGLSPAEGRLVKALIGGETLSSYAERIGVSINTVRTQLQHTFEKTGFRRQGDLTGGFGS